IYLIKLIYSDLDEIELRGLGEEMGLSSENVRQLREKYLNPKIALVVPMASFRRTLKKVFSGVKGLRGSMVIGPSEAAQNEYDILFVDESHRLRRRVNLGSYYGRFDINCCKLGLAPQSTNELDGLLKNSRKLLLFYDSGQSIRPSDVRKADFDRIKKRASARTTVLKSQFRVRGGNGYVDFISKLLAGDSPPIKSFTNYEVTLCKSMTDLVEWVNVKENEFGLSRMIAGYSWEWLSKSNPDAFDLEIDDVSLRWNSTSNGWIHSAGAVSQVGCIHTTQGYDLNFAAIIFGNEIGYDKQKEEIVIREEHYFDKAGKHSISDPDELKQYILNIYKTILLRAIHGTCIYVCDADLREFFSNSLPCLSAGAKDIRPSIPFPKVISFEQAIPWEGCIPLYDLRVAAGEFGVAQEVSESQWVEVESENKQQFACTVIGDSMNRIIPNGSLCLFEKYQGGSRNGLIVLVECTDYQDSDLGSCYTVKEYSSTKRTVGDRWEHQEITLKPRSTDSGYQNIELRDEEVLGLKVIAVFKRVLWEPS
ncbi:MAG: DUF2075 domain-containing protein, partial [Planctomycetes bacterium]|nr:DUF2075 domain-containing protein [Planctomycetota bacterium]